MAEKGGISVQTEHIFPIIKRWLYSDKEIFLREIVSNASDAITKLKHLIAIGEATNINDNFRIDITIDKNNKTMTVEDNGIGMTEDEIKRYINQIALSGALDFIQKYENNTDGIIGHFGLGFYSAFMVSDSVEIKTKSYLKDMPAVNWTCSDEGEFELSDGDKEVNGTQIIMHINDDEKAFLEKSKALEILSKYCSFMPIPIYLHIEGENPEEKDGKPAEEKPLNETEPLWQKNPSQCTEDEYKEFYQKVFNDYKEPLFHIHLNADYPLNFKGILYFPKLGHEYESLEGEVKLYYNRVFVADNIKEVIPEYLLMLKGVLDCPDLPLNVSRSYLQNSGYVSKVSSHIVKKVCDKLISLHETEIERFKTIWDDIKVFVEYGCMRDHKFYERIKDIIIYKTIDGEFITLSEYIDKAKRDKKIFYTNDVTQQAMYINMFKAQGIPVVVLDKMIDTQFINVIEQNEKDVKFLRIDANTDELRDGDTVEDKTLQEIFAKASGKTDLKVMTSSLKDEKIPAILNISEESRRMADMMKMYKLQGGNIPTEETLVLNSNNVLIRKIKESSTDITNEIAKQIYNLALLSQRQLTGEELGNFLTESYNLLERL